MGKYRSARSRRQDQNFYHFNNDAKRPSARARGYDAEWQTLRAVAIRRWLDEGRPCALCGLAFEANNTAGIHLDHIKRIADEPDRRLDPQNWRAVHAKCHSQLTAREDAAKRRGFEIGASPDGMPTDPRHPFNRGGQK